MKDYYAVLGVNRDASQQQIKAAYRSLSKKHHPDLSDGSEKSDAIFKDVQEAHRVLKDESSRQSYDAKWAQKYHQKTFEENIAKEEINKQTKAQTFDFGNLESNFEEFFGFHPKTKRKTSTTNNQDKKNPLDTSDLFEQFFNKR